MYHLDLPPRPQSEHMDSSIFCFFWDVCSSFSFLRFSDDVGGSFFNENSAIMVIKGKVCFPHIGKNRDFVISWRFFKFNLLDAILENYFFFLLLILQPNSNCRRRVQFLTRFDTDFVGQHNIMANCPFVLLSQFFAVVLLYANYIEGHSEYFPALMHKLGKTHSKTNRTLQLKWSEKEKRTWKFGNIFSVFPNLRDLNLDFILSFFLLKQKPRTIEYCLQNQARIRISVPSKH